MRVHLMLGLSGAGKTTLARELEAEGALRLTLDEWMIDRYPGLRFDSEEYGERVGPMRDELWAQAAAALAQGRDVVLDWNAWSRKRRTWVVERARPLHADLVLHWLRTSHEDATRRLAARAERADPGTHPTTADGNLHLASLVEEPTADEGFVVILHESTIPASIEE